MRKVIGLALAMMALTGCPNENEVQDMQDGIAEKKAEAVRVIQARDYSLEGLLKTQDYFFYFSEKVHLMLVEPDTAKNIQRLIEKDGIKDFCSAFVVPLPAWRQLESYCSNGSFYKCSPEIKEYENTLNKFKELIGTDNARLFENENTCLN